MKYKEIIAYDESGGEYFIMRDTPPELKAEIPYKTVEVVFDGKEWKIVDDEEDKK